MREIKFRAWNKLKGGFAEKLCLYLDDSKIGDVSECFHNEEDIESYEIEQYTGLKDKNGKEIYEGDILHCRDDFAQGQHSAQFKVLWCEGRWAFQMKGDEKYGGGYYWEEVSADCKVIGNIHENPELLA